ncbi:MAG: AzlD domain-containing protein [Solirubrobacterales bacterium]|nr:AzlD domain-containing protein [Solirubrobacterales bacterium]
MAEEWTLFALMFVTTALIRASGPVVLGGRELPPRVTAVVALLAPALLAALVMSQTFRGDGTQLIVDERALGVAGAGIVMLTRGSIITALAAAMIVTAGTRALF